MWYSHMLYCGTVWCSTDTAAETMQNETDVLCIHNVGAVTCHYTATEAAITKYRAGVVDEGL